MNKRNQIILMVVTALVNFLAYFLTRHITSLFIGITALGMLLMLLGEKIISRIIILIFALLSAITGLYSIITTFMSLI